MEATTQSSILIPESDPRLNTPQPDYTAIHFNADGSPFVADRYLALPGNTLALLLALARIGMCDEAERVANCCRSGSVSRRCVHGRFATAHRHHCGSRWCPNCNSGKYRFNKWAAQRDHHELALSHEGIELRLGSKAALAASKDYAAETAARWVALRAVATQLMERLGECHATFVLGPGERAADASLRIFYHSTVPQRYSYAAVKVALDSMIAADFTAPYATIHRGSPQEVEYWAFSAWRECCLLNADHKAALEREIRSRNLRTVSSIGDRYRTMTKREMEEWEREHSDESNLCPICKDHDLEKVPMEERHTQPVEEIAEEYEHVDWQPTQRSPFVVRRGEPTDKLPIAPAHQMEQGQPPPW